MVKLYKKYAKNLSKMDEVTLLDVVANSIFMKAKKGHFVRLTKGGYIFDGELFQNDKKIPKYHEIYPSDQEFEVT